MQTPEQLAAAFIERLRLPPGVRGMFTDDLVALLVAYGDERAALERERAAHVADDLILPHENDEYKLGRGDAALEIRDAIRALQPLE